MNQENTMTRTAIMEKLTTMGVPFKKKDSLQTLKDTLENALNERHYEKYGRPTENAMEQEAQKLMENLVNALTTKKEEENTMNTENVTPATIDAMNTENKEDKNMTKNNTPAPKKLTKKAQSLIADIQTITPAYGDRLESLSIEELTALRRMLKDRATALANVTHSMENTALTGQYTDALDALVHTVYNAIPESIRGSFNVHADPKKKKLMVRWSGKSMLFKVFIQRKGLKVHLKTEDAWKAVPFEHEAPFFQNGFNLPWAVKMNDDQFAQFLQWIFTTV